MADYMECPLHWLVASDDYFDQFEARLQNPNERDADGNTLLHVAAMSSLDNSRVVQLLMDRGADENALNPDWFEALHFAVASHNRFAFCSVIEAGAFVHSEDFLGKTALHFSVCKGLFEGPVPLDIADCDMWIVERLLHHPEIELHPTDENWETPLMWAIKERNIDAFEALLKAGANPDVSNIDDKNSLHVALSAKIPSGQIVFTLLTKGVGIYSVDRWQLSPIDLLLRNIRDDSTLAFAVHCVKIIAIRYRITDGLKRKLDEMPSLLKLLNECCKEVRLMKKLVIYDKVTLHDFCLDCFQTRSGDPVRKIYIPVIEMLLSGWFKHYRGLIRGQFLKSHLLHVLTKTAGRASALDLIPTGASNEYILMIIKRFYTENLELKERLHRFDHLL